MIYISFLWKVSSDLSIQSGLSTLKTSHLGDVPGSSPRFQAVFCGLLQSGSDEQNLAQSNKSPERG
jgi:hypothetical protein